MTRPFLFEAMLVFGWLASMLFIAVLLRARMHCFQRFLFPGCQKLRALNLWTLNPYSGR